MNKIVVFSYLVVSVTYWQLLLQAVFTGIIFRWMFGWWRHLLHQRSIWRMQPIVTSSCTFIPLPYHLCLPSYQVPTSLISRLLCRNDWGVFHLSFNNSPNSSIVSLISVQFGICLLMKLYAFWSIIFKQLNMQPSVMREYRCIVLHSWSWLPSIKKLLAEVILKFLRWKRCEIVYGCLPLWRWWTQVLLKY